MLKYRKKDVTPLGKSWPRRVNHAVCSLFYLCSQALAATNPIIQQERDCSASDENLRLKREIVCASLVQPPASWCNYTTNVTASEDWPNQAVYMQAVLDALISPTTCLDTNEASYTVSWLSGPQTNVSEEGSFMWTWQIFQPQYYDMPRKPGDRIEAPDTLGRKCWAMAYLRQLWNETALSNALNTAHLDATPYINAADASIPLTMTLCSEVLANCFVNASYDPSRNGTCAGDAGLFYLGFERENALRGFIINYPFYS
jgi:hypothetical protein